MELISILFIPAMITAILLYGLAKKVDVYQLFVEGAKDGLLSAASIMPSIIAIFLAIDILTASGCVEFLMNLLAPLLELLGIPTGLFPLILMKPVSGSGSLVIVENIMRDFGTDSFVGKAACILMGSSETILYTFAVYFAVTSVKKARHTMAAGMISYVAGVAATLIVLNLTF